MNYNRIITIGAFCLLAVFCIPACTSQGKVSNPEGGNAPYVLSPGLKSRSISFENPSGAPGEGGKESSNLGIGRKGAAWRLLQAGEEVQLCDIEGTGVIRHIWMTFRKRPVHLRGMVIRGFWDDQKHPSIECPIGDFMGFAHGVVQSYQSAVHSVGQNAALNLWLPMPFAGRARFTLTNETGVETKVFYQVDYTLGDILPSGFGRLHVLFRRENPTASAQDFEILPKRSGRGRFMGCVLGVRSLSPGWWGEGEVKFYLDGDTDFPTICGTGSEDYVCLSYGMQQTPFLYHGCSLLRDEYVSMYRWHVLDPIVYERECRVTIQQMGIVSSGREANVYSERQDDWSSAAFWYEAVPSAPLPPLPGLAARLADIPQD